MTLEEFEDRLQEIRAKNGWIIVLECGGVWMVRVFDKETNEFLSWTGATTLEGILIALEMPLDEWV